MTLPPRPHSGFEEEQLPLGGDAAQDVAYDPARDEMVEIVNLSQKRTGVPGTIFISTRMAAHGPRIKWWPGSPERNGPCPVVTLGDPPRTINMGLPPAAARASEAEAVAWATLNRGALLRFWQDGAVWMEDELRAFLDGLRKLP
ncbi:hypothetical protein DFH01_13905 [Falsiroseomonas bella]|uniref:Uncharacterized protein n=1 Tax=Falsiroseomonas bella TaxID=2184016 RepID=A0A317FAV5_9PROT|nr:hypothetical protein [Falsiroseomonas bella]PWS36271.1 hypothetical protein DFH01_13905 [Falsiroseomonas bella]